MVTIASDEGGDSKLRTLVEGWKGTKIMLPSNTVYQDPVDNFIYNQLVLARDLQSLVQESLDAILSVLNGTGLLTNVLKLEMDALQAQTVPSTW